MASYRLAQLAFFLIPVTGFAQDSTATNSYDRKWADIKFKSAIELRSLTSQPGITSIPLIKTDSSSAFSHSSPNFNEQKQIVMDEPSQFHSNMPVVKPPKTSKILVAKIDPEFPYHYNMPIKKVGGE